MSAVRAASGGGVSRIVVPIGVGILLALMAYDTTVVRVGSEADTRTEAFSPVSYAETEFPRIRSVIEEGAVDAPTLAAAIAADKDAATTEYGTPGGVGPIFPVIFTGVAGEGRSGIVSVAVEGLPEELLIRVQTGPAINGTELRDAPGDIAFGQFTNQIEYQNAGAALNEAMKAEVLSDLDRDALAGRTVTVTGVFRLINPKSWLVTPISLEVQ